MQDPANLAVPSASAAESRVAETGNYPPYQDESSLFNLATIRAFLWRQRLILIGVAGAAVLISLIMTLLMTPIYQTSATVRVDVQEAAQIVEGQELSDPYIHVSEVYAYMETLGKVIASRSTALEVVDSLNLQDNESLLGETIERGAPDGVSADSWKQSRRQQAAGILMANVAVDIPMDTRIITITYQSSDPILAARIANSYADNFLSQDVKRAIEANAFAMKYLEDQISQVRNNLQDSEVRSIDYARANRIVGEPLTNQPTSMMQGASASGTAPTVTASNLAEINSTYSAARARRIGAEQRWRTVSGIEAAQLPEVQQSNRIQTLRTQLAELRAQLADLQERYRDDYPQVRELQAQIATLSTQIDASSAEIKSSIRNEFDIAQRQEQALLGELNRVSDQTLDEQDRRVQYNLIERDVGALQDQLSVLLARYNQIASAANLRSNRMTKLDVAMVPSVPSSPNLMRNLFIALVLGVGLAAAIALLREVLDDRLRSVEDVERKLGLPSLGQTPFVQDAGSDEIDDAFSAIGEAYASIRASLDFAMPRKAHQVIQFTSSQASEGKTTTSVAIARKFASVGRKVLLVDMDLRRPSVAKLFGRTRAEGGVIDVLYGRLSLERALLPNTDENLDVLAVGQIPPNPVEVLSSGLMAEFLDKYRGNYDVIIVDSSPVMGIADSPLLSRFVDGVVFVVEANRAHFGAAKSAVRRLRDMNANIVGAVVTKFRALEAGESYNYQYNYYTYGSKKD